MVILSQDNKIVLNSPPIITVGHPNAHGVVSNSIYAIDGKGNLYELGSYEDEVRCQYLLYDIMRCYGSRQLIYEMPAK